jgi:serine protease Do
MNRVRKSLQVLTLCGATAASTMLGMSLFNGPASLHAAEPPQTTPQQIATLNDLSSAFREIGKSVEPAVVNIRVTKTISRAEVNPLGANPELQRFFRQFGIEPDEGFGQAMPPAREVGTGSGVIMEVSGGSGFILTNNHVAGGASELMVTLADGREIKDAKVLGADPRTDLAVVQIKADNLVAAKWGDSGQLQPGDWVMAFGSPFGYVGSMTHGIVSALHRQTGMLGSDGYENFIQVDAPINPGNSGGPLTNLKGEVVGINSMIASSSGGFQGLGFAIPSNQAKPIFTQLKEHGAIVRGWLGAQIQNVSAAADEAGLSGFKGHEGVLIRGVLKDSPAASKLQPGDVVTSLNGKSVKDANELRNTIATYAPGTEVTLGVYRDGKQEDLAVKLGQMPEDLSAAGGSDRTESPRRDEVASLGLRLTDPSDAMAKQFDVDGESGALVAAVQNGSPAASAGLRAGDLITRVNRQPVTNAKQAREELSKGDLKKGISMLVKNQQGSKLVFLQSQGQ